jgi:hypothetical protein
VLASADLCVGALSSATLQGAVLGVPTVFLDVSGAARPWPFDGSEGALPLARDAAELAELAATARGGAAGGAAEALGLTGSGKPAVLRLIDDLATGPA